MDRERLTELLSHCSVYSDDLFVYTWILLHTSRWTGQYDVTSAKFQNNLVELITLKKTTFLNGSEFKDTVNKNMKTNSVQDSKKTSIV